MAAALAALLDLPLLSFAESKNVLASFAKALFEAGQSVPYVMAIDPTSYLPSRAAVSTALKSLVSEYEKFFKTHFINHWSIEEVQLLLTELHSK